MLFILLENVFEDVLISMFGVVSRSGSRICDRSKDRSKVDRNSFRVDAALFDLAVSRERRRRRVAVTNPNPADCVRDDSCRPEFVILPVLFLMRIRVVIRDERHELDPWMIQQEARFPPENVSVRPNQIPLTRLGSSSSRSFAVLLTDHVVVIHAADNLAACWKLPVFAVESPSITKKRFHFAASGPKDFQPSMQKWIVNTDSQVNHWFLRLVSERWHRRVERDLQSPF